MKTLLVMAGLAVLAVAAAACGGGSDGDGPGISPPAEPEATARPTKRATAAPTDPPSVTGSLKPADDAATAAPTEAAPQPESAPDPTAAPMPSNIDPQLIGSWRIYSESLYYDAGGGGVIDSSGAVGTDLVLHGDGSWEFGSSSGWWSVAAIDGSEWDRWLVSPYGPARKIVLQGWNGDTGDGPLDEESGYVDFVWLIYHVDSPDPGTVYMKFGH